MKDLPSPWKKQNNKKKRLEKLDAVEPLPTFPVCFSFMYTQRRFHSFTCPCCSLSLSFSVVKSISLNWSFSVKKLWCTLEQQEMCLLWSEILNNQNCQKKKHDRSDCRHNIMDRKSTWRNFQALHGIRTHDLCVTGAMLWFVTLCSVELLGLRIWISW